MEKEYWYCIIGPIHEEDILPSGSDAPLRDAVQKAFSKLISHDAELCSSAWGISEPTKDSMLFAAHFNEEERPKLSQEDVRDVFGLGQKVLVRAGKVWEPRKILGITVLRHKTNCPHCGGELLGEPRFWFKDHGNVPLAEIIAKEDISLT